MVKLGAQSGRPLYSLSASILKVNCIASFPGQTTPTTAGANTFAGRALLSALTLDEGSIIAALYLPRGVGFAPLAETVNRSLTNCRALTAPCLVDVSGSCRRISSNVCCKVA